MTFHPVVFAEHAQDLGPDLTAPRRQPECLLGKGSRRGTLGGDGHLGAPQQHLGLLLGGAARPDPLSSAACAAAASPASR